MKNIFTTLWAFALAFALAVPTFAQDLSKSPFVMGKIAPYHLAVTYDKTSHLIFPTAIRYVDLGSENLIAGKVADAENVLRVKASLKDFGPETNFSVITDDGRFYSFDVHYSPYPEAMSYDLSAMRRAGNKTIGSPVLFEELGNSSPMVNDGIMKTIIKNDDQPVKGIRAKNLGIRFLLRGIYIHDGKYYFHTEISNHSNIPYEVDHINFKVVDKKNHKRTAIQERSLDLIRTFIPLGMIPGKSTAQNVLLLDRFYFGKGQILLIEIFEANGGRHLRLKVRGSDLVKARLVNDIQVKF